MKTPIIVPRYGRFLIKQQKENIRITKWYKNDGDQVEKGELVVNVETSKASLEIESPASGILICLKKAEEKASIDEVIGFIAETQEEYENKKRTEIRNYVI